MRRLLPAIILFSIAIAVRLNFLLQIEAYPKFELIRNRLDDQVVFDYWAKSILHGETPDFSTTGHEFAYWTQRHKGVFPQAPLYPYFLASLYKLFGSRYDWVRGTQMVLGAFTTVLVYVIGRRYLQTGPAFLCGLAAAFYGPFVFYEGTFLRAGILTFVTALSLHSLHCAAEARPGIELRFVGACLGAGVTLAAGVLLRANFLIFALPAVAWVYLERSTRTEHGGEQNDFAWTRRAVVLTLAGLLIPLVPVIAVNTIRGGRLAFVSSNGPYNFYIGNVHDALGYSPAMTPTYLALKASGPPESVDLVHAAIEDIHEHPKDYIWLQLRKVKYFFVSQEIPNNLSYGMAKKLNPALTLAFVEFNWILPAAIVGLALSIRKWKRFTLLYLFTLSYAAATITFFVLSRLRQPAVIPLIVFAGVAAEGWWRTVTEKRLIRAVAALVLVVVASVYLKPDEGRYRAADYEMAAAAYSTRAGELERGARFDEARRYYIRALVLNPDDDEVLLRIRAVSSETPNLPSKESSSEWIQAGRLCGEARRLLERKEYEKALTLLEKAASLAPDYSLPHHYLSNAYFLMDEPARSMEHLEKALELVPENRLFRENLKALRRQVGTL